MRSFAAHIYKRRGSELEQLLPPHNSNERIPKMHYAINRKYPNDLTPGAEGAVAEFLRPSGSTLILALDGVSEEEQRALRNGTLKLRSGLIFKNGAILFLWQFIEKGQAIFTFDSPFDARIVPDLRVPSLKDGDRLVIDVHVVDTSTGILKALRSLTLSPEITEQFRAAVEQQLLSTQRFEEQLTDWSRFQPVELAETVKMHDTGV